MRRVLSSGSRSGVQVLGCGGRRPLYHILTLCFSQRCEARYSRRPLQKRRSYARRDVSLKKENLKLGHNGGSLPRVQRPLAFVLEGWLRGREARQPRPAGKYACIVRVSRKLMKWDNDGR